MSEKWLVIGANKGIGFGLVKEIYAKRPKDTIYATARDVKGATDLVDFAKQSNGRIIPIDADFNDPANSPATIAEIKKTTSYIDNVIQNSGAIATRGTIEEVTGKDLLENVSINAAGTQNAFLALLPLVEASPSPKKMMAVISSNAASSFVIPHMINGWKPKTGRDFTYVAYSISKATQKALAQHWGAKLESKGIIVPLVHPGSVSTGPRQGDGDMSLISVEESAAGVMKQLFNVDLEKAKTGILGYDDKVVPW